MLLLCHIAFVGLIHSIVGIFPQYYGEDFMIKESTPLGLVYLFSIFISERCGDTRRFGVHPILSNPFKYSFPKILESF
jgi:hypothetical protein